jgi:hypothetical protein
MLSRGLLADDDNLWLLYLTEKITKPHAAAAMEKAVIDLAETLGSSPSDIIRLVQREAYGANYWMIIIAWSKALPVLRPEGANLETMANLASNMLAVIVATLFVFWILVLGVVASAGRRIASAVLLVLLLTLALQLLPWKPGSGPTFVLLQMESWQAKVVNLARFLIDPGPGFSVFGFTPRNLVAAILIAVFALRWSGRVVQSYVLLVLTGPIHASLSVLCLAMLLAIDLTTGRSRLRSVTVLMASAAIVVHWLFVETLWRHIGPTGLIILPTAAAVLATLAWYWVRAELPFHKVPFLEALVRAILFFERQRSLPMEARDLIAFTLIMLISLPLVLMMSFRVEEHQFIYFWGQVHGRMLGVFCPSILCAAVLWTTRFETPARSALPISVCLALVCLIGVIKAASLEKRPSFVFREGLQKVEGILDGQVQRKSGPVLDEAVIYLALYRALRTGEDPLPSIRRSARARPPENSGAW